MRRRAHIEFLGQAKICITTFAMQKTFDLDSLVKHKRNINLVTLKTMEGTNDFYADVYRGDGTISDPYILVVYAHESEGNNWGNCIAKISIRDNCEETVEVTLVE